MTKTTEELPPEPRVQPNIEEIIALLVSGGEIDQSEKKQGEALSATGKIYQRIEKNLHGNRAAVAAIRRLQKMSDDKRADYIRTFEPLLVHFGYTLEAIDPEDLLAGADQRQAANPPATSDDDDDQGDDDGDDGEAGDADPGVSAGKDALQSARERLSGGGATAEPGKPAARKSGRPKLGIVPGDSLSQVH